ncbi:MAG: SH3 domain-containing protein [Clostridia bacterium]|nr:SH3 domain-containing protein [Clostridia bacterium]
MKPAALIKRTLCLALALMLMTMTAALAAKGSYYVSANNVYVRSGPSSSYSAVAKLNRGKVVNYLKSQNGWYQVRYSEGKTGWIYRKYLSTVKPSSSSSSTKVSTGGKYRTTGEMNMRSKASLNGSVVGKVKKGATVTVKSQSHGWAYVSYNGKTGWIAANYLKKL